ncbi:hypothetical protein QTO34_003553 [Cnephaeus nilssonii]|uniref:G-protein coupled receptors family 1 profile domain-containing protein n=1 Tax=Cnephaeus nilssonii TaxID=3371016 RepID=A0AA40LLA2_CNENI|nr:hypothetical protein QTO34_003553 [Eptesicus nilssonii]
MVEMGEENCTTVTEFILLGLSDVPELRVFLSLLFLLIYGVTVLANLGMIALIQVSCGLHTPMYFFLSHLSFLDFCYSTIIVPKMLFNMLNKDKTISFLGCMVQFYLFCVYAITEVFLLAMMAYDRFVAICNPLLYMVTMSRNLCVELVSCCYLTTFNEIITIVIIFTSYLFILITILRMHSAEGRHKAFSTCASHLTAIVVLQGTLLFSYCRPNSGNSVDTDKVASVFYTVVIPMLNPLIYSLRNKDVKEALRKVGNCTTVTEFILLGLSDVPELRVFLSLLFLLIYGVTVLGNLGMIALIQVSSGLHTPMYFFLSHLSFVDLCYSTIIVPKMLFNMLNKDKTISFLGCMVQFYLFCVYGITEVFLLAVMAYDRFVAICNPLLYMVTMSQNLCMELVSCCYLGGTVCSLIHLCLALEIPSFRSNVINHFFCDLPPLLSLACTDVFMNELLLYIVATFNEIITIVIILTSYLFILITILRMHSAEGRHKAFSTCASHLTAIYVLQGTLLFSYCRPNSGNSVDTDKVASVFYTVVIPMLNPLIYSLRNKDVKEALKKVLRSSFLS